MEKKKGETIVVGLLISNIYIKLQEEALSRLYYYYFFFTAKAALSSLGSFILVHLACERHAEGDVDADLACSQGEKALL